MDFTVIDELKMGQFRPFYLLYGEEQFLIEKTLQTMKETMLDSAWADFNYSTIDLMKSPIEAAIEEAESFPFGEGRRLIVAKNAFFLTATNAKSAVEHSTEALLQFLDQPTDFSSLVLVVSYNKLDERKKVVKELLKKCRIVQAAPLNPHEWESWILSRIAEKKLMLDNDVIQLLLRYLPNNLQIVENELEKLSLYGHNKNKARLSANELLKIISKSVEGNVFDLVENVVNHNFQAAYEIYRELMKQNEEPIMILALLARQFRMILQSKLLSNQGYSQKQIATHLKVHPYPIKIAVEQGKRFGEDELTTILDQIAELDYQIKTGQRDRHLGLEMLLLSIQSRTGSKQRKLV